jgi:DUF1365 family protein
LLQAPFRPKWRTVRGGSREYVKKIVADFKHPLMSVKLMAGFHWEALKLWRKGLGLQERPSACSI